MSELAVGVGVAYRILDALGWRRSVDVRGHRAFFGGVPPECLIITVTNRSPRRDVEITHVWIEHESGTTDVSNAARPLPKRLRPDEHWATWIAVSEVPATSTQTLEARARVRLSNGAVRKSRPWDDVPPAGAVPGP